MNQRSEAKIKVARPGDESGEKLRLTVDTKSIICIYFARSKVHRSGRHLDWNSPSCDWVFWGTASCIGSFAIGLVMAVPVWQLSFDMDGFASREKARA